MQTPGTDPEVGSGIDRMPRYNALIHVRCVTFVANLAPSSKARSPERSVLAPSSDALCS